MLDQFQAEGKQEKCHTFDVPHTPTFPKSGVESWSSFLSSKFDTKSSWDTWNIPVNCRWILVELSGVDIHWLLPDRVLRSIYHLFGTEEAFQTHVLKAFY